MNNFLLSKENNDIRNNLIKLRQNSKLLSELHNKLQKQSDGNYENDT